MSTPSIRRSVPRVLAGTAAVSAALALGTNASGAPGTYRPGTGGRGGPGFGTGGAGATPPQGDFGGGGGGGGGSAVLDAAGAPLVVGAGGGGGGGGFDAGPPAVSGGNGGASDFPGDDGQGTNPPPGGRTSTADGRNGLDAQPVGQTGGDGGGGGGDLGGGVTPPGDYGPASGAGGGGGRSVADFVVIGGNDAAGSVTIAYQQPAAATGVRVQGSAQFRANGQTVSVGLDVRSTADGAASGTCSVAGGGVTASCTRITGVTRGPGATTATITGTARVPGGRDTAFRAVVSDNANPNGAGRDTITVTVDGRTTTGTVSNGNLTVG